MKSISCNNGESLKDKLLRNHSLLGKHKLTSSSAESVISNAVFSSSKSIIPDGVSDTKVTVSSYANSSIPTISNEIYSIDTVSISNVHFSSKPITINKMNSSARSVISNGVNSSTKSVISTGVHSCGKSIISKGLHSSIKGIISNVVCDTTSSKLSKLLFSNSRFKQKISLANESGSLQSSNKQTKVNETGSFGSKCKSENVTPLSYYVSYAEDSPQNSAVESSIEDVLKRSFQLRESLPKKSNIARTVQNVDLDLQNGTKCTEWDMSRKDPFLLPLNSILDIGKTPCMSASSDITSHKIVEHTVKESNGNLVDISWDNPIIGTSDQAGLPSVVASNKNKLEKLDKVYSSCSFTIEMLKNVKVLGQVDNKFIACLVSKNLEEMLILVDQHAAHERIRLEKLLNQVGYYSNERKNKSIINGHQTQLSPPTNFTIHKNELDLMVHYKKEFNNIGLKFSFVKSTTSTFHRVFVSRVPAVFVNGRDVQLEANGSVINIDFLKEFILEQIQYMRSTGCPCNMTSRTIFKALASYACHGAIKFGDKISSSTCEDIMVDLAKCALPFQCAHGRPTIAPIFKLNFLDSILKKSCGKPNLSKLKEKMRI